MTSPQNCSYCKTNSCQVNTTSLTFQTSLVNSRPQNDKSSKLHKSQNNLLSSLHYTSDIPNFTCQFSSIEWQVLKIAHIVKQILVKLTLHLWHSKLHFSILINRMIGPQNCSYRKSTLVMLTSHLWQITFKFNATPLTMIKLLPGQH